MSERCYFSNWIDIDQGTINAFADLTRDAQFIHVDPERAAKTPFGGTIAHGFLLVSMLTHFASEALPAFEHEDYDALMSVNYGFDKLRFLTPAPSGARIRGAFSKPTWRLKNEGQVVLAYDAAVEIEGREAPALVADWLFLLYLKPKEKTA